MAKNKWLNRNIWAMGWTSFFSDFGHEMATAILPSFVIFLGGSAALLGLIEGLADASTSLMKVVSGWYSDYIGRRKPFAMIGYFLTAIGVGSLSLAVSWPFVLLSRVVAWIGRGTREPPRDALLADSVKPEHVGKAFGLNRALDTLGAVCGPALAVILIRTVKLNYIFLIALIPSLLAFLTITIFVREKRKRSERTSLAISLTASKSPGELMGKPASITSTPSFSSCLAICSFSWMFNAPPAPCSPSRNVVSKIITLSIENSLYSSFLLTHPPDPLPLAREGGVLVRGAKPLSISFPLQE